MQNKKTHYTLHMIQSMMEVMDDFVTQSGLRATVQPRIKFVDAQESSW